MMFPPFPSVFPSIHPRSSTLGSERLRGYQAQPNPNNDNNTERGHKEILDITTFPFSLSLPTLPFILC